MNEESIDEPLAPIDKAAIDTMNDGSWLIWSERSQIVSADNFSSAIDRMLARMEEEEVYLDLRPLRYILLTPELPNRVKDWQRQLGIPEAGVSQQSEGVAVGKTMSWGKDRESARTIILLDDSLAAAAAVDMPIAVSTIAHEFAHVTDYFERSMLYGFSESKAPVMNDDWSGIRRAAADSIWSEYAAESTASMFLTEKELREFRENDALHLAGVDDRIRQSVVQYKAGQVSLAALWNDSVTNLFDLFTNLGRVVARAPPEESDIAATMMLAGRTSAASWTLIIEKLLGELRALRAAQYENWSLEPLADIEDIVELGFRAVGLIPEQNKRGLRLQVL